MLDPKLLCSCAILALATPSYVVAQENLATQPEEEITLDDTIVVVGERIRGQVDTEQEPILELNEEDIAAYGAGSIADLVEALGPQTESSRGRGGPPVFLINGVRVGSFREFRSYPPEAIRKVEVLPEETAQKFGFAPDRRVVNFILKDDFSAVTVEAEYEQPSIGGYSRTEQEATLLKITGGGRLNFNLELNDTTLLTESERDIVQTESSIPDVATDPDPAEYRSLIADSADIEATANYAKAFLDSGSSLGLNATFNRSDSRSLSGLDSVLLTDGAGNSALRTFGADNPLERRSRTDTSSTSASYNRPIGDWQLTATADGSYADSTTEIDRRADTSGLVADALAGTLAIDGMLPALADAGFDTANLKTYAASSKLTLAGRPFYLPAGDVSTTFDLGYDWTRLDSDDSRAGSAIRLTRGDLSGGFNVSVPIASTRDDVLAALGSVTLNGQVGFNHYSDFGTLYRWSGGVNWAPTDTLDLQATYVWREVPPSLAQLGNPQVTTFNVPTFDFATGDTVLATVTTGGNPLLQAETQSDWSVSANWEVPFIENARFRIDYSNNRSSDVSSSFPFLTPEIEAAFPGRVTRDAGGTLTAIDSRPVDFFETRSERLTVGLTLRGAFGEARPQAAPASQSPARSAAQPAGRPAAGEGRGNFAAFRERLCADDGEAFLLRLIEAASRGETIDEIPGFDPQRAQMMLSRVQNEDGTINRERLAQFRSRVCEGGGPGGQGGDSAGERPRGAPDFANMSEEQRSAFMTFRTKVCAADGDAFLLRFVEAAGRGEALEDLPGFDPERAERMIARFRNEDGTIAPERLAAFRSRICSMPGAGQASGPPAGGNTRQRGGGPGFGRGGDGRGRFFFNLSHSFELNREVLIAPGGPALDLLNGDSLSSTGTPSNSTRIEAGMFRGGLGLRLSARYTGPARIDGTGAPTSTDLFIDDLASFDLRLFADLGELLKKDDGIFKGMRMSFRFDNIFDGRRIVRDGNGDIPVSYQPLLIDPTGRYLGMEIRKLF
ncbi:TonB-dependent receptor [Pontixanthobacter aquaemixtae]|uniref:TonB-dependent receptor-like beta-barrel domain-containing protein n=1 Tax=Pontixanthobacter aquaemixtae TaxID=1958940 RepID=A0A844ZPL2_9SPHN|nr:hypothetical protein [Pontixanthobacter aquaemixtae]MXO89683.1 hypothetical protein [Pontixanthobacter aquaemixtae]